MFFFCGMGLYSIIYHFICPNIYHYIYIYISIYSIIYPYYYYFIIYIYIPIIYIYIYIYYCRYISLYPLYIYIYISHITLLFHHIFHMMFLFYTYYVPLKHYWNHDFFDGISLKSALPEEHHGFDVLIPRLADIYIYGHIQKKSARSGAYILTCKLSRHIQ